MPNGEDVIFQQLIRWYWSQIRHACLKDKGVVARRIKTARNPGGVRGDWTVVRGQDRVLLIESLQSPFPKTSIFCAEN